MSDEITTYDNGSVQIIFEIPYGDVNYRDALYFTADEYSSLSESDIEKIKTDRYSAWISAISPVNSN